VLEELDRRDAILVAVSPELPDGSLTFAETNTLGFDVLSDARNGVAREYGLLWRLPARLVDLYVTNGLDLVAANGNDDWELPVPGTFVLDCDGVVRLASADADYRSRLEPSDLLATIDALA
jgi:peroxiredoxin